MEAGVDVPGLAAAVLASIGGGNEPDRRLLMSRTEAAFREGFLTGRRWPKFAPYATDIWRKSDFYLRSFARKASDAQDTERYSRFNHE